MTLPYILSIATGYVNKDLVKSFANFLSQNKSIRYITVYNNAKSTNHPQPFFFVKVSWDHSGKMYLTETDFDKVSQEYVLPTPLAPRTTGNSVGYGITSLKPDVPLKAESPTQAPSDPQAKSLQSPDTATTPPVQLQDTSVFNAGKCFDLFDSGGKLKDDVRSIMETDWTTLIKPKWFANPKQDPVALIKAIYGTNTYKKELFFLSSTCKQALFSKDPLYDTYSGYNKVKPNTSNLPFESNITEMQAFHRFMKKLNDRLKAIYESTKAKVGPEKARGTNTWKNWSKETTGSPLPK